MKRILVTGAGGAAASNFIDALRLVQEPMTIVGVDASPWYLPLAKSERNYLVPQARSPDYIVALNRVIEREKIDFVHAQPDPEVEAISAARDRVAARTFLPAHETILLCADKMQLAAKLQAAGVPAPASFQLGTEAALKSAFDALQGTIWLRATRGAGARASLPVQNLAQARWWIEYWAGKGVAPDAFMACEFLPGREFAFQSLWHEGKLIVSQARERVVYLYGHLTPSGQTSTPSVARTVHRDDINDVATRAIRAAESKPHGVFCADLKEDAAGQPRITEINCGRFFTTSNFYAHAGVNFPHLYVRLGLGESVPACPSYNAVPADYYWIRMTDMGYRLVRPEQLTVPPA